MEYEPPAARSSGSATAAQAAAFARARGATSDGIASLQTPKALQKVLREAGFDRGVAHDVADVCASHGLTALLLASGLCGAASLAQLCYLTMDEADVRL